MAFFQTREQKDTEEAALAYDLRQRRAKLIADCIELVVYSFKEENFRACLKNIDDLYSVSNHTFTKPEEAKNKYHELRKITETLAADNANIFLRKVRSDNVEAQIDTALRNMFEYLMNELDIAGVFGNKDSDEDSL